MDYYFFTTNELITMHKYEHIFNFQLLGFAPGENEKEAFEELLEENPWLIEYEYNLKAIKAHRVPLETILP